MGQDLGSTPSRSLYFSLACYYLGGVLVGPGLEERACVVARVVFNLRQVVKRQVELCVLKSFLVRVCC